MRTRHTPATRRRGQALVEFSIVLPLFLVMVFGIIDLGRVVWANTSLANAAREAARYAIVHAGSVSRQPIIDTALRHAIAGGSGITVTVCYGTGCTGNDDAPGATNVRHTPVTVSVTGSVSLVTTALLGLGSYTVRGASTMVVSN